MSKSVCKPESECSQAELLAWRGTRIALAALGGGGAAAAVLIVLGLVSQFPTALVFGLVCCICAAVSGLAARLFIHVPPPELLAAMRDIRAAGGSPAGERLIETWE